MTFSPVLQRRLKIAALLCLTLVLLLMAFIALFDWNWLRGPVNRYVTEHTGREFAIRGDLRVRLGWPVPHITASQLTFANPDWAKERRMVAVDEVEIAVDLPQLFKKNIFLREVRLDHPVIYLEQASDGRKNWLLDKGQQDENSRLRIGTLTLNQGTIAYLDEKQLTGVSAEVSSGTPGGANGLGVVFSAKGRYKGNALTARGSGGPVLSLNDESKPYPLQVGGNLGKTHLRVDGSVTSLIKFAAVDMHVVARGESLADLFPLLGIALPETPAYSTAGHLVHRSGIWRYEGFTGKIGSSDIAGAMQVDSGGPRPFLHGDLASQLLDFEDLGPLIGARKDVAAAGATKADPKADPNAEPKADPKAGAVATAAAANVAVNGQRVLPDLPFRTDRWNSVDADVGLVAKTIRRAKELPIENLNTRILMRDSVLTLNPLKFGVAGGTLSGTIVLDGKQQPIRAHARIDARKLRLAKLFPTIELTKASIGQVDGEFDLAGNGNSVAAMLGSADGKVALVVEGGAVSRLMMETIGLHLFEILELKLAGDQSINIRCVVADFGVNKGVMRTNALVFDTDVTTVEGRGDIDLGKERFDLILDPQTKRTSPVALSTPIYIRGPFAKPVIGIDKGRVAVRGLGAVALGLVNPFLALLPLIDAGPGPQSQCAKYVREARDTTRRSQPSDASKRAPVAETGAPRPGASAQPPKATHAAAQAAGSASVAP